MSATGNAADHVASETKPLIRSLARLGHAAKGLVYVTIGVLAVRAAIGAGGATAGSREALASLVTQPFGKALMAAIAAGLFGYSTWRLIQAFKDPDREGRDWKGLATRSGYVISAVIHYGLALAAIQLVTGGGGGGGSGDKPDDWTAWLMAKPFGRWLVIAVGAGIIAFGIQQIYSGIKRKFTRHFQKSEMSEREYSWAVTAGRAGHYARGVVFGLIGWFLIRAGLQSSPEQAGGLGEALADLASRPYGPWLLGMVALGLIAYGFYCFVLARYRRIAV